MYRTCTTTQTAFYTADVISYGDYYPFGMQKPGRFGAEPDAKYRYKHQGQESDSEILGEGNGYAYEYRMSDARLGRFWRVDPLASKYPYNSPYAFSENRVIDGVELEGLEFLVYQYKESFWTGKPILKKFTKSDVDGQLRTLTIIEHNYSLPNVEGATAPFKTYIYTRSENDVTETLIHTKFIYSAGVGIIKIEDNDDNAGYIQNATETERRRDPANALFTDLSADLLNTFYVFGSVDNAIEVYKDPSSTTAEKIAVSLPILLTTSGGGKIKSKIGHTQLKVGDQLDLSEFMQMKKSKSLIHKSGWMLEEDFMKGDAHRGQRGEKPSAYKLKDPNRTRKFSVDKDGEIIGK